MKRSIAALLILILMLCLAACGEKKNEEQKKITVGFNTNSLTNETMSFMVDVMTQYCNENNMELMVAQDSGDTATTQNNLENMVAGGCQGIIYRNQDPKG